MVICNKEQHWSAWITFYLSWQWLWSVKAFQYEKFVTLLLMLPSNIYLMEARIAAKNPMHSIWFQFIIVTFTVEKKWTQICTNKIIRSVKVQNKSYSVDTENIISLLGWDIIETVCGSKKHFALITGKLFFSGRAKDFSFSKISLQRPQWGHQYTLQEIRQLTLIRMCHIICV